MVTARELKKGAVITLEGAHWVVEECRIQQAAKRRPVLHAKMHNMATGHIIERTFDESHHFEQPEVEARRHQFLYHDKSGYVFMDTETFDQITVLAEVIGDRHWLLKEGNEFTIQFIEGAVVEVIFPANFVDEIVETAEPSTSVHGSHVMKEAKLVCGLTVMVPLFIKVGESVRVDVNTHMYVGREAGAP